MKIGERDKRGLVWTAERQQALERAHRARKRNAKAKRRKPLVHREPASELASVGGAAIGWLQQLVRTIIKQEMAKIAGGM